MARRTSVRWRGKLKWCSDGNIRTLSAETARLEGTNPVGSDLEWLTLTAAKLLSSGTPRPVNPLFIEKASEDSHRQRRDMSLFSGSNTTGPLRD